MWSILPSKPLYGLKRDAFAWCTFLTWHGHGKCSWMHLRAAGTGWQWRGSCSPALNRNVQESVAASSAHHRGPGSAPGTDHAMGHVTCHLSRWIENHCMQEKPKSDLALKAQIRFAWLSPNPPDCISLPFTLFSQAAAKPVSKISWTKTIPKEQLMTGACRTKSPRALARPSSGALQKKKTLKQSKCLEVQQENPFYYNLIKLIVKQRPCSTKPQSPHDSCSVLSANGSQVHPKGIPPRREVNPCKGHCVNHHALSLAAAVGNCLWRSRNETLVNPSPNTTKIKHHHYPPHKWPWATKHFAADGQAQPISGEMLHWRAEKAAPLCKLKVSLLISSSKCWCLVFPHLLVQSTIALIIPLKLPPDSEQLRSWNSGNVFNQ